MLSVENLNKSFGGIKALQDVTFDLQAGEAIGLVGDNGAGKSTLLKCLSGAMSPDHGHIMVQGRPLAYNQPGAVRRLGIEMVYQDLALCRQQTVLTNLLLGREPITRWGFLNNKEMGRVAREALTKVNADIPLDAIVGTLSGGQQQAVAIARALLANPRLVIFDEPTASLGVRETARVIALIQGLTKAGIAVIVVSHRLNDVIATTTRILLMRQGRIANTIKTNDITAQGLAQAIESGI